MSFRFRSILSGEVGVGGRVERNTDTVCLLTRPSIQRREEDIEQTIRSRMGWLIFFFFGLMISTVVVEQFEDLLKKQVALSYFVPLLIGHGGNSGSQTVTTVIRAVSLGEINQRDWLMATAKEGLAGTLMGCMLGCGVFSFSFIYPGFEPKVALTVAVSLPIISLWANTLGVALPLLAQRLRLNPAVTAAPLMTTIVDATGLLIYFFIAKYIIGDDM